MDSKYSSEKGIQILLALLKKHNIRKVVACPGGTNMMLNASLMHDDFFEMYSCDDERSAAYIATGMSEESGEPVMITCTGATAARNFMPGLTEAYYRKLPILVLTCSQDYRRMGNLIDQITDRSVHPKDILNYSAYIQNVRDKIDESNAALRINQAISALTLNGGGPAHINLETTYSQVFNADELPDVKVIRRIDSGSKFPEITHGKIAIFVGSHKAFSDESVKKIDEFCQNHNAVVFCDHTSNYKGNYRQINALLSLQHAPCTLDIDLLIHIGEISGDHFALGKTAKTVWRISEDGQMRDRYGKLTYLFNMSEDDFFDYYNQETVDTSDSFITQTRNEYQLYYEKIPELPFSNIWMAKKLHSRIPENSCIHFGILTSLRSWNFFDVSKSINTMSNVGGFGTDGMISSLLGASLVHPDKLYFGVVGDLAFFYDMTALGNRHLGRNVRLLLVNNGKGCEFKHSMSPGHIFKDEVDPYISAAGHFGNQSESLVRDFARNLGLKYLTASSKEEFESMIDQFVSPEIGQSCVFEVFTKDVDESEALRLISRRGVIDDIKNGVKDKVLDVLGENMTNKIKNIFKQ